MIGGLILVGCGLAVLATAIAVDTIVAFVIRKWRASEWDKRHDG